MPDSFSIPLSRVRIVAAIALPLAIASALAGCATVASQPCAAGERAAISEWQYFGTAKPGGGTVSDAEWDTFLREAVTPRFTQGFSHWPVSGQWLGADGQVVREASHVLAVVYPAEPQAEAAAQAIASEYKARFQQEAVLRVRSRSCVSP